MLYAICAGALLLYGLNHYILVALFLRKRWQAPCDDARREAEFQAKLERGRVSWPPVLTQIPLYNEANVAERVIRAAATADYPGHHEVQVLDDSDDETRDLVDRVAAELNAIGKRVSVVRRPCREGFKAGALAHGLRVSKAPLVAVFDSDFVPTPDFLRRSVPHLISQPEVALVQARWGHLNAEESWLTRALAVGIDGHFLVEQPARAWNGLFLNFNGTAGIWRREAIAAAGGWQADTLTEDMDLSYRAQLAGWRIHYLRDVVVPAELPSSFAALRSQQFRWAKGSIQTARKLLPRVLAQAGGPFRKLQSIFHLTNYSIHFAMTTMALLALPAILVPALRVPAWLWPVFAAPIVFATLAPTLLLLAGQAFSPGGNWRRALLSLPGVIVVGFGLSLSNARAVLEGFSGSPSAFVRTPKRGHALKKRYRLPRSVWPWLEMLAAAYCVFALGLAITLGHLEMLPYLAIYAAGYAIMGGGSLLEQT